MSVATEPAVMRTQATDPALARRLILAAAVSAAICAVAYLLMVHTALGHRFDNAALLGSEHQVGSARLTDESILRRITGDSFALILALIVGLGLARRRPRLGVTVAVAAAVAVIITELLRKSILPRPVLVHSDLSSLNTYPSGHTATAISCALALVVVSPPAWRGISAILAGSYAWFTAAAVQTAGWHRPSDAIGAAFLSFAVIGLFSAVVAARRPVGSGSRFTHLPAFIALGLVWLGAAAISLVNALHVLRYLSGHADTSTPPPDVLIDAYRFSIGFTIVVVVSLIGVMLLLLGPADLDEPRRRSRESARLDA